AHARHESVRDLVSDPDRTNPTIGLAQLYLRIARVEDGIGHLKRIAGAAGDMPLVRALVETAASAAAQPKDFEALADLFSQIAQLKYQGTRARQGEERGRLEESYRDSLRVAQEVCAQAARRFPSAAEPRVCAGKRAAMLEQVVLALKYFEQARKLDP